ncbi:hypothetical protein GCM10023063_49440 [Arthrobacter methylotrophus]
MLRARIRSAQRGTRCALALPYGRVGPRRVPLRLCAEMRARCVRIQADIDDARRAGAQGTPTFVLDGEVLQLQEVSDLTDALDSA